MNILQNSNIINIINNILKELLELKYGNNNVIIRLENYIENDNNIFKNNYYKEIFYFIYLSF